MNDFLLMSVLQRYEQEFIVSESFKCFFQVVLGTGEERRFYPHRTGGPKLWRDRLVKFFPDEENQIDEFMKLTKEVRKDIFV